MRLRTQLLLTVGTSVVALGVLGWLLWRPSRRGLPMPWGLLALMAAVIIAAPLIGTLMHHRAQRHAGAAAAGSPRKRVTWVIVIALAWLTVAPLLFRGTSASWLAGVAGNLHMALMFVGLPLAFGCVSRQGDEPRCGACGYDLSGATADGEPRCPECGGDTRMTGGIVRGRKVVHRWMLAVGVVLLAAQVVWLVVAFRSPVQAFRWHVPLLPTGALIKEVTAAPRGFTRDEWAVLAKRSLSSEQERRLARGLLDLRTEKGFIASESEAWLLAAATSGRLPPDLLERYAAEWLEAWIVAPDRARVGAPVTVGLSTLDRGGGSFGLANRLAAHVLFEGFGVGGEAPRRARSAALTFGLMLQPHEVFTVGRGRFGGRPQSLGMESPTVSIVPEVPGRMRMTAALWIVICPPGTGFETAWVDDAPTLPAGTLWARRVELEHVLEVGP